jgi:regulator of chromosome condensation
MATRAKATASTAKKGAAAAKVSKHAASKTAAPKKAAASKPATTTKRAGSAKPTTNAAASKKRKADDEHEIDIAETKKPKTATKPAAKPTVKKAATPAPEKKPAAVDDKRPHVAIGKPINDVPTKVFDVYVFGEGTSGELGLGSRRVDGKKPIDVKRPRLNANLSAADVGVVQLSCGGMHAVALTRDNKILTWGVNDQGALGRDTTWEGNLRDMDKSDDSDSEEDEDDTGINPHESTPAAVSDEYFAKGTKFVQVIACDSATFVLTEDGRVYGWGTFRSSDGILGFTEKIKIQYTPILLPSLKNIAALASGANHILALDTKGNVSAWGSGQQNQLGRRIIERNKLSSLIPQGVGLPRGKVVKIACGSYHSFALDKDGKVWGWGLNNFGEVGVEGNAGEDNAVILRPAKITLLEDHAIRCIDGGGHHTVACNEKGELITWGRVDGSQVGIDPSTLTEENAIFDDRKTPRILFVPTVVPGKQPTPPLLLPCTLEPS